MRKERLTLEMTTLQSLMAMAEGNPGALTACMEVVNRGPVIDPDSFSPFVSLMMLDSLGIYGSRLYMLWSDVCGRDVAKMIACLRAYQLGQIAGVTEAALNHAIDNRGAGLDLAAVMSAVAERLPNFNRVAVKEASRA